MLRMSLFTDHTGRVASRSLVLLLTMTGTCGVMASQLRQTDTLERVSFLVGRWEGRSAGQPGQGTVRREYSKALNGRFIRVQNRSEYPPQERNPKGEVHEDEGIISFDRARMRLVLRQFH